MTIVELLKLVASFRDTCITFGGYSSCERATELWTAYDELVQAIIAFKFDDE